jgi:hypothetical protein
MDKDIPPHPFIQTQKAAERLFLSRALFSAIPSHFRFFVTKLPVSFVEIIRGGREAINIRVTVIIIVVEIVVAVRV